MRHLRPAAHIPPSMSNMCMIHLNTTHCGLGRVHLGYHTWGQISLGCVVGGAAGLAWLGLTHRVRGQSARHVHTCSRRGSVCGGLISRIWRTAMSGGCLHLRCGSFCGLIAPRLHVGQILVHGCQWCGGYGIPLTSDAPVARSYPWPSHPHRLFTAPVSRHPSAAPNTGTGTTRVSVDRINALVQAATHEEHVWIEGHLTARAEGFDGTTTRSHPLRH